MAQKIEEMLGLLEQEAQKKVQTAEEEKEIKQEKAKKKTVEEKRDEIRQKHVEEFNTYQSKLIQAMNPDQYLANPVETPVVAEPSETLSKKISDQVVKTAMQLKSHEVFLFEKLMDFIMYCILYTACCAIFKFSSFVFTKDQSGD